MKITTRLFALILATGLCAAPGSISAESIIFGPVQKVYVKTDQSSGGFTTESDTFVGVPGAFVNDAAPTTAAYHVTFSAVCAVAGGAGGDAVMVRVVINGVVVTPGPTVLCEGHGGNLGGITPEAAHAQQWAVKSIPAGTNTIRVQWMVDFNATFGSLRNYNLTVRRHQNAG